MLKFTEYSRMYCMLHISSVFKLKQAEINGFFYDKAELTFFPFCCWVIFFFLRAMCCESRLLLLQSNDHCDVLTWLFTIHLHALVAVFILTVITNDIHWETVLLIDAWSLSHPSWLHLVSVQNPDLEFHLLSTVKASQGPCSLSRGLNTLTIPPFAIHNIFVFSQFNR